MKFEVKKILTHSTTPSGVREGVAAFCPPREKDCWIPRRSQSKVYECTGGPESSSTTMNTCSAGTILVHGARTNSSQTKSYMYTAGWPGK